MKDLSGKTALVTGGSRGIGRSIAVELAAAGARVAVHYGDDAAGAQQTVDAAVRAGGSAFCVRAPLGEPGDVDELFAGLEVELAGSGLDIVVNNAATSPAGPMGVTTEEEFDRLFAVNVRAPYFIIERSLPLLRDFGRVITISSVAARMANSSQTSFAMTKGAIETMTMTLANVLGARGITVNAVAPGATRTAANQEIFANPDVVRAIVQYTALDRLGEAEDVAHVVRFLASDAARWVTGQIIDASGGLFLGPRF